MSLLRRAQAVFHTVEVPDFFHLRSRLDRQSRPAPLRASAPLRENWLFPFSIPIPTSTIHVKFPWSDFLIPQENEMARFEEK
jgi:hypothetical protein